MMGGLGSIGEVGSHTLDRLGCRSFGGGRSLPSPEEDDAAVAMTEPSLEEEMSQKDGEGVVGFEKRRLAANKSTM